MRLYHRTSTEAAQSILATGFRDATGSYMTEQLWAGVWLSDVPLDVNEGAGSGRDDVLLEVELDLPDAEVAAYEWVEEGKTYREFLIPAEIVNRAGRVRDVTEEEGELPGRWGGAS